MSGLRVLAGLFLLLGLMLLLFAPVTLVPDSLGDPGPALLPRLCGGVMVVLAVLLFLQRPVAAQPAGDEALPNGGSAGKQATERRPVIIASMLSVPAFFLVFQALGFTVAVAIYLFFSISLLGQRNPAALFRYALVAVAFSLLGSLVFGRMLDIPMPGMYP